MRKFILGAVGACLVATPALADEKPIKIIADAQNPSAVVTYGDLDLRQDADVAILEERIQVAAGDLCYSLEQPRVGATGTRSQCFDAALYSGKQQVEALQYHAHSGQGLAANPAAAITVAAR